MDDAQPLYQMNPQDRFSDRADDYSRHRPSYPAAVLDWMLEGLHMPIVAADIGAGTGISARLLADRDLQVWAIEPNAAMRMAAATHERVMWRAGSAEATGLSDGAVDLVTCFQAFHWFHPEHSLKEFHRILRPTGRLAIVWNHRDRRDGFTEGYTQIVKQLSQHHPAEEKQDAIAPLINSGLFQNIQSKTFANQQALDLPGLIGRARSVSYIPKDEVTQTQLVKELESLYQTWVNTQSEVCLAYSTQVFLAEPCRMPKDGQCMTLRPIRTRL